MFVDSKTVGGFKLAPELVKNGQSYPLMFREISPSEFEGKTKSGAESPAGALYLVDDSLQFLPLEFSS